MAYYYKPRTGCSQNDSAKSNYNTESEENVKTKEEILQQYYISAKDLRMVIPTLGINKSIEYIKMIQEEMKQKGYFIPQTKELLALTKLARKKFGF